MQLIENHIIGKFNNKLISYQQEKKGNNKIEKGNMKYALELFSLKLLNMPREINALFDDDLAIH